MQNNKLKHHWRKASKGLTLLEIAIGLMILSVISVAVSALVKTGVEAQLNQRLVTISQTMTMNLIDDIRFDVRTAESIAIANSGRRLNINGGSGSGGISYIYRGANNTFERRENGAIKLYNDQNIRPQLDFNCTSPCFSYMLDARGNGRTVVIDEINITPTQDLGTGSAIASSFPLTAFKVTKTSFDVISSAEFE